MSDEILLRARDVRKHFPIRSSGVRRSSAGTVRAVDGVSLDVRRGETLGLVGESGCGKSTLGRCLMRLTPLTAGTVEIDGEDISTLSGRQLRPVRRQMQMIFQDPYSSLNPRQRVGSIIALPLQVHATVPRRQVGARVGELLDLVGLRPEHADRFPHEFSGGQRQRIGIARALALDPRLLIADEPVSALDVSVQAQVVNLLTRLRRELGLACLFIAHDLSVVRQISDRVAVMYLGRVVEVGPAEEVIARPFHPYAEALVSAVPVPDPERALTRERIILSGDVPSAASPPPGCHFHPRCRYATDVCRTEVPPLRESGPAGHAVACHHPRHQADSG